MAGRILIADDVVTNRIVLKVKLASAHYRVSQCTSAAEVQRVARAQDTDLIVLPTMLPDQSGFDLCRRLKADPATAMLPVLMLVPHGSADQRFAALEAGADDTLHLPLQDIGLLARVRSLLRARETDCELHRRDMTARQLGFGEAGSPLRPPGRVALIGADPEQALGWKSALRGLTRHVVTLMSRTEALALDAGPGCPDLFCIAADLENRNEGLRLLSELRSRPATRHAAILTVHPRDSDEAPAMALDLGANALIESGFPGAELALIIDRQMAFKHKADGLRASVEHGLRMASVDPLTGLFNRRYSDYHLAILAERARKMGRGFAVLMVDIDRFKTVNDRYGHAIGDKVLASVAAALRDNLRAVDLVARYGGEEFVIALPDADLPAARHAAERLRGIVAGLTFGAANGCGVQVSVSIGLAMVDSAGASVAGVLAASDRALYQAKTEGRNRICVAVTPRVRAPQRPVLRGPLPGERSSRTA